MALGPWLHSALTENLNLKFLSIVTALILYSVVHDAQDHKRTLEVNLEYRDPPESSDRVRVKQIPAHLRVALRGPRAMLSELSTDNMPAVKIDLRSGVETRIVFEKAMVQVPPGIKVEQIEPSELDIEWEDRIVQDVPVQVSIAGTPAPGFVVKGAPAAEPKTVRVRGPRSEVSVLQHVRADPFDVAGLTEGRHMHALAVDKPRGRIVYDTSSIQVTVDVTREVVERPFAKIPIVIVGQLKAKTQPAEVDVRLTCPPEIVRALRPEQLVPRVHVTNTAEHGSDVLPVQLTVDRCDVVLTPNTVVARW